MKGSIRATVKVSPFPQRERRFTKGTPARVIKAWKASIRAKLLKRAPKVEAQYRRDTLAGDASRYYPLIKHLSEKGRHRRSEIRAWLPYLGETHRHMITREDVLRVRGIWIEQGIAAKTINNRVSALRNLYTVLDGNNTDSPCHGVHGLTTVPEPPQIIDAVTVNAVLAELERRADAYRRGNPERRGRPYGKHAAADRARLMVLASTGKRPCEVERATKADVDLRRRVWVTRDAKGGFSPGVYLNDEMICAWEAFIEAEAWGKIPGHFARRLRDAGWPKDVRPYNLRHSTWIEASERGADLADIQAGAGHKKISTTRIHYVPVRASRMQKMSESLDGRFGWQLIR